MIGPAGYRSCLARSQPRTTPSDEDLQAMRRAAWRTQGVIMLGPEDVRDDWTPPGADQQDHILLPVWKGLELSEKGVAV
jgi:hypothetical protein